MARQRSFDEANVAQAGLAAAGRLGWNAISVRSVAEELSLSPMALYRVVPDAAALRRLIANAAATPFPSDDGDLAEVLRAWATRAYRGLARYPGLAGYVIGEWTELPAWLDIVEAGLLRAAEAGLDGATGVAHVNAVFAFVLARGQLRDGAGSRPRRRLGPVTRQPHRYPLIQRNRAEFAVAQTDKHFAFGLDSILAAMPVPQKRS